MANLPNEIQSEAAGEMHRHAYNAAFDDLGLAWHWDCETWRALNTAGVEEQSLRRYVETQHPHLLRAYDADFLVGAIQNAKARHYSSRAGSGRHIHA
jgi:hypothetical protein